MKNERLRVNILLLIVTILSLSIIMIYINNFYNFRISKDPSDWGALGDYFGGLLNPLISIITLFFVAKAYLTQKEELRKMELSADKLDKLRENATQAQISLAESYLEQVKISNNTSRINLLSSKISSSYKLIELYHHEMDRVTEATNKNRIFISMYGEEKSQDQEQKSYRTKVAKDIQSEINKIEKHLEEIDSIQ
ncbi:hypothetical protein P4464_002029 [Salmonella enterica]|uniref:Uncharacterized protein n=1 Tax=Salmonella enterica TaxID=28901 RepID=A0A742UB11_SALER|nr:hypothetical protein [Salmonella enterica subsp. enterica serovar Enteritidis]EAU2557578.1 hypothetical protein [Salmonella enterica]EKQ3557501.1 hypothetical protein [Salmonella enterica]HAF1612419.1 hypothetical protein [Salmonella enterica]